MRVFILTSCVGTKKYSEADVKPVLEKYGLPMPRCDLENEEKYKEALKDFILPAFQMYQGSFKYIWDLVKKYRQKGDQVDLRIISARYGLISGDTLIIPYECTFQGFDQNRIRDTAEELRIYQNLLGFLEKNLFDLSVVILGVDYLLTVLDQRKGKDFFNRIRTKRLVTFAAKNVRPKITLPEEIVTFIPISGLGDRNRKLRAFVNSLDASE